MRRETRTRGILPTVEREHPENWGAGTTHRPVTELQVLVKDDRIDVSDIPIFLSTKENDRENDIDVAAFRLAVRWNYFQCDLALHIHCTMEALRL